MALIFLPDYLGGNKEDIDSCAACLPAEVGRTERTVTAQLILLPGVGLSRGREPSWNHSLTSPSPYKQHSTAQPPPTGTVVGRGGERGMGIDRGTSALSLSIPIPSCLPAKRQQARLPPVGFERVRRERERA